MLLSFSKALGAGWAVIWTVVFAGVWVYGLYELACLTSHSPFQVAFGNWLRHEPYYAYPLLMPVVIIEYIALPLAVYLALTHNLTLRAFTVGLSVGAAAHIIMLLLSFRPIPFFHPISRALNTSLDYLFAYARAEHWNVRLWLTSYEEALRWSLPLLTAICSTKINRSALRRLPGVLATTIRNVMLGLPRHAPCD